MYWRSQNIIFPAVTYQLTDRLTDNYLTDCGETLLSSSDVSGAD